MHYGKEESILVARIWYKYIYIYIYIYIFNSFKTIHKPRRELYNKTTTQVLSLMFEKKINGQFEKKIYSMFGMFAFSLKLY